MRVFEFEAIVAYLAQKPLDERKESANRIQDNLGISAKQLLEAVDELAR